MVSTMTEHDLRLRAGGNQAVMTLKADGRVGIGTAAPGERLEVAGQIKAGCLTIGDWPFNRATTPSLATTLLDQDNSRNYALAQGSSGSTSAALSSIRRSRIDFRIGNVTRMALANDGRFGIGTSAPQATLHIATGDGHHALGGGGYLVIGQTFGAVIGLRRQRNSCARMRAPSRPCTSSPMAATSGSIRKAAAPRS